MRLALIWTKIFHTTSTPALQLLSPVANHGLPYYRQQRFGRLLQKLKVNAVGGSGGSTTPAAKPKNANKKGGKGRKQHEEEEEEDESDDSDSPSKKRATVKNGIKRETAAGHALSDSDDGELKESFGLAAKTVEAESDEDED